MTTWRRESDGGDGAGNPQEQPEAYDLSSSATRNLDPEATVKAFKILGITTDVDTCERCGRTDLKRTVALEPIDGGRVMHVGTICGSRLAKLKAEDFRKEVKAVESAQARDRRIASDLAHRKKVASWESFLADHTGHTDVWTAIDSLGGFVKARAAYRLATTPTA